MIAGLIRGRSFIQLQQDLTASEKMCAAAALCVITMAFCHHLALQTRSHDLL